MWHVVSSPGKEGDSTVPMEAGGFHAVVLSDLMTLQPGAFPFPPLPHPATTQSTVLTNLNAGSDA